MAFWKKDDEGFQKRVDTEKLVFISGFAIVLLAVTYRFLKGYPTDLIIVNLTLGVGALVVTRKGVSYFKPEAYYANNKGINLPTPVSGENTSAPEESPPVEPKPPYDSYGSENK